jgi:hypothetical protein
MRCVRRRVPYLAKRRIGENLVHKMHRNLRHAPPSARRAQAGLARERDEQVLSAPPAAPASKSMREHRAPQESTKLPLDAAGQGRRVARTRVLEKRFEILPHELVQRGRLRVVAPVLALVRRTRLGSTRRLLERNGHGRCAGPRRVPIARSGNSSHCAQRPVAGLRSTRVPSCLARWLEAMNRSH